MTCEPDNLKQPGCETEQETESTLGPMGPYLAKPTELRATDESGEVQGTQPNQIRTKTTMLGKEEVSDSNSGPIVRDTVNENLYVSPNCQEKEKEISDLSQKDVEVHGSIEEVFKGYCTNIAERKGEGYKCTCSLGSSHKAAINEKNNCEGDVVEVDFSSQRVMESLVAGNRNNLGLRKSQEFGESHKSPQNTYFLNGDATTEGNMPCQETEMALDLSMPSNPPSEIKTSKGNSTYPSDKPLLERNLNVDQREKGPHTENKPDIPNLKLPKLIPIDYRDSAMVDTSKETKPLLTPIIIEPYSVNSSSKSTLPPSNSFSKRKSFELQENCIESSYKFLKGSQVLGHRYPVLNTHVSATFNVKSTPSNEFGQDGSFKDHNEMCENGTNTENLHNVETMETTTEIRGRLRIPLIHSTKKHQPTIVTEVTVHTAKESGDTAESKNFTTQYNKKVPCNMNPVQNRDSVISKTHDHSSEVQNSHPQRLCLETNSAAPHALDSTSKTYVRQMSLPASLGLMQNVSQDPEIVSSDWPGPLKRQSLENRYLHVALQRDPSNVQQQQRVVKPRDLPVLLDAYNDWKNNENDQVESDGTDEEYEEYEPEYEIQMPPRKELGSSERGSVPCNRNGTNSRRQLLRPWLEERLDRGNIPGFQWMNKERTLFRIPWKHRSKNDWSPDNCTIFKDWAIHTGKHSQGIDKADYCRWKTRLRCAFNQASDIRERKELSRLKGSEPYKVYEFLPKEEAMKVAALKAERIMMRTNGTLKKGNKPQEYPLSPDHQVKQSNGILLNGSAVPLTSFALDHAQPTNALRNSISTITVPMYDTTVPKRTSTNTSLDMVPIDITATFGNSKESALSTTKTNDSMKSTDLDKLAVTQKTVVIPETSPTSVTSNLSLLANAVSLASENEKISIPKSKVNYIQNDITQINSQEEDNISKLAETQNGISSPVSDECQETFSKDAHKKGDSPTLFPSDKEVNNNDSDELDLPSDDLVIDLDVAADK